MTRTIMPAIDRGPIKPLTNGSLFPQAATVTIYDSDDKGAILSLTFEVTDGHVRWTSFSQRAREGEALPQALPPLGRLVEEGIAAVAMAVADSTPGSFRGEALVRATQATQGYRRRSVTPALLAEVAKIMTDPENALGTTEAVAHTLHCSHRTARRWAQTAREEGLL